MPESLTRPTLRPSAAALTLDRLGPSFGAEVIGLDLTRLTDEHVQALREALVDLKVLFFRGQRDRRAPRDLRDRQRRHRSTSHYANRDYDETRVMRRITLAGDKPVGPGVPLTHG